jgi:hypothetical protein
VLFLSNPENGIYTGKLNEDIDLVYFKNEGTYGVHYADKTYQHWYDNSWKRSKQPLESRIKGLKPNEWTKYSSESDNVIGIAANNEYPIKLTFEGNIKPAINEIVLSIREVHKQMIEEKLLDNLESTLIEIEDWKNCFECGCYHCYQKGLCGTGCDNPNMQTCNNILEV